jgi:hypothetical protein
MLVGTQPLQARNIIELSEKQKAIEQIKLPQKLQTSELCRELVHSLLIMNPAKRMSWEKFFEHSWLVFTSRRNIIKENAISSIEIGSAPARIQCKKDDLSECEYHTGSDSGEKCLSREYNIPSLDLLMSFEIVKGHAFDDNNRKHTDAGSEDYILQELQKWNEITETLCDVGKKKIDLGHFAEGLLISEHCISLGNVILEMVDKHIQQNNKKKSSEQHNIHSADHIKELEIHEQKSQLITHSEMIPSQKILEFNAEQTKIELLTVRISQIMRECENNVNICRKQKIEKCKPIITLLCDSAISLEKQGSMEIKIEEYIRAKEHFSCAIKLFESVVPFTTEIEYTAIVKHLSKLNVRLQNVKKFVTM